MGHVTKYGVGDFLVQIGGRQAMGRVVEIVIQDIANLKGVISYRLKANDSIWDVAEHAVVQIKNAKLGGKK